MCYIFLFCVVILLFIFFFFFNEFYSINQRLAYRRDLLKLTVTEHRQATKMQHEQADTTHEVIRRKRKKNNSKRACIIIVIAFWFGKIDEFFNFFN